MNARNLAQATLIAALFAAGAAAQASPMGEADAQYSQPMQVQSTRSFADQQAASLGSSPRNAVANSSEGFGENVHTAGGNATDRQAVRAAAIQASRSGAIERGDALSF
ncbi:hypothetical protein GN316_14970 [Xylophilus sp. Kf1]|nr:hypothetical protein [Xylophilus sp. Kf1]